MDFSGYTFLTVMPSQSTFKTNYNWLLLAYVLLKTNSNSLTSLVFFFSPLFELLSIHSKYYKRLVPHFFFCFPICHIHTCVHCSNIITSYQLPVVVIILQQFLSILKKKKKLFFFLILLIQNYARLPLLFKPSYMFIKQHMVKIVHKTFGQDLAIIILLNGFLPFFLHRSALFSSKDTQDVVAWNYWMNT